MTTLTVGLKKRSHTQKSHPRVVNARDIAGECKKNPEGNGVGVKNVHLKLKQQCPALNISRPISFSLPFHLRGICTHTHTLFLKHLVASRLLTFLCGICTHTHTHMLSQTSSHIKTTAQSKHSSCSQIRLLHHHHHQMESTSQAADLHKHCDSSVSHSTSTSHPLQL